MASLNGLIHGMYQCTLKEVNRLPPVLVDSLVISVVGGVKASPGKIGIALSSDEVHGVC